jgi:DNA-binding response OmpR family regulator
VLAGDGEEGLKVFRESRPSLVIADLGMPMVRGRQFVIESLELGAYAFLTKPMNVDELLLTAERALERRQLLLERRQDRPARPSL